MDELPAEVARPRARVMVTAAAIALLAAVAGLGCVSEARAPLSDTFASPEEAAAAVLVRVAAGNRDGLLDLAVDEHEFRRVIWPELPSSRPEVGLPWDYAWRRLNLTSRAALAMTLAEHGGRRYRLQSVRFTGEVTRHASFAVHRDTTLVVQAPHGVARPVRLFGSMVEQNGRWKVFSYVVD